jgi:hypothetical protein
MYPSVPDTQPHQSSNIRPFSLRAWLGWTALFLVALMLTLELISRSHLAQRVFPNRGLDVYPYPFEIKWRRLQEYVSKNGGVDILLVGSSVVNTGIDPDIVRQTYTQATGKQLRIFNFGVEGLTIVPDSVFAKLLVQTYHPALVIFVTLPRDYLGNYDLDSNQEFLSSPWIQYRSGQFNGLGWLIDSSIGLQRYLFFRDWTRSDFLSTMEQYVHRDNRTSASGYEPDSFVATNLNLPPNPANPSDAALFSIYHDYAIDPNRLSRLEEILALQNLPETRVIVMEMPMHPTFYLYMGGEAVHRAFQQKLSAVVTSSGSIFIPADDNLFIPSNGHSDREHLNFHGAPAMSVFVGQELAALTLKSHLSFSH